MNYLYLIRFVLWLITTFFFKVLKEAEKEKAKAANCGSA